MSRHLLDVLATARAGIKAVEVGTVVLGELVDEVKVLSAAVDRACDLKLQEMGL